MAGAWGLSSLSALVARCGVSLAPEAVLAFAVAFPFMMMFDVVPFAWNRCGCGGQTVLESYFGG